jgi:hypothetical protein
MMKLKELPLCSGRFITVMGLPCVHQCLEKQQLETSFALEDFDVQWHWDQREIQPPDEDPFEDWPDVYDLDKELHIFEVESELPENEFIKDEPATQLNSQSLDSQPLDSQPLDSQPLDSQSLDSQPLDSQSLDSQSLDSQPLDSQQLNSSQPFGNQLFNSQLLDEDVLITGLTNATNGLTNVTNKQTSVTTDSTNSFSNRPINRFANPSTDDLYDSEEEFIGEPLKVKGKGAPKLPRTRRTGRILSGFEATESAVRISHRKCGVCKRPGHNRNNKICNGKGQATFDRINVIRDEFNLHGVIELPPILEPEPEPEPEPVIQDTRPISPNRIEILYQDYLARKAAFLTAHPTVRPRNYRRAAGLSAVCEKAVYKSQRKFLPYQRIDLATETLVEGRPHWTDEEVQCYIDEQERLEEVQCDIEQRELEACGGRFRADRGNRELQVQIDHQIVINAQLYKFT